MPVYDRLAELVADLYESTTFEAVHADVLDLLPSPGSRVLDVGAGSGRDAAALAARGYAVTAVEPSARLREQARLRHASVRVEWIDDALPGLRSLDGRSFALILISAVWMHLTPRDRLAAMRRLADLLVPGGRIVISLRMGPDDPSRAIRRVDAAMVEADAERIGLSVARRIEAPDALDRRDVYWVTLVLDNRGSG